MCNESGPDFNCINVSIENQKFMDQEQEQCKCQWLFPLVSSLFSQTEEIHFVSQQGSSSQKKELIQAYNWNTPEPWYICEANRRNAMPEFYYYFGYFYAHGGRWCWWWLREPEIGRRKCVFPLWFISTMWSSSVLPPFMLFFKSTGFFVSPHLVSCSFGLAGENYFFHTVMTTTRVKWGKSCDRIYCYMHAGIKLVLQRNPFVPLRVDTVQRGRLSLLGRFNVQECSKKLQNNLITMACDERRYMRRWRIMI